MVKTQHRYKNLENERVGRLLVIKRDWERTSPKNGWKVYWICKCDCGNFVSVRAEHLKPDGKQHHTQSCGCAQKEAARVNGKRNKLPVGEFSRRSLFHNYQKRAEKKGLTFFLTRDIFDQMIGKNCFYCGSPPSNKHVNRKDENDHLVYNGIDRKDSTRGYEPDNVVTCCSECNYAKSDTHIREFVKWLTKAYHHMEQTNVIYEWTSNDTKNQNNSPT